MAAVSVRKMRLPKATAVRPFFFASFSSLSLKPPSQPTNSATDFDDIAHSFSDDASARGDRNKRCSA
jgi:hypothetical protein